ncbi:MAG: hypothetical protein N3G20_11780, partial [Verrucomicrobiae bacterium]|nr:hypothetical protein [Verrucomicrobiae bacterium]
FWSTIVEDAVWVGGRGLVISAGRGGSLRGKSTVVQEPGDSLISTRRHTGRYDVVGFRDLVVNDTHECCNCKPCQRGGG